MSADHRQYQGSEREHQTAAALFLREPGDHAILTVARWDQTVEYGSPWRVVSEAIQPCARCGSLVLDRDQHTRWHASTDSAAPTELGR